MNSADFQSVENWYEAAKREGYLIPLALCVGLSKIMRELSLTFHEAFELLVQEKRLLLVDKTYLYDLSSHNAWLNTLRRPEI